MLFPSKGENVMTSNGKHALAGAGLFVFLFSLVLPAQGEDAGWKAK